MQTNNSNQDRDTDKALSEFVVMARLGGNIECTSENILHTLSKLRDAGVIQYSSNDSQLIIRPLTQFKLTIDGGTYMLNTKTTYVVDR